MENSTFSIPDINLYVAGCTLWSNVSAYTFYERMNDICIKRNKKKIHPSIVHEWHEESKKFIRNLPILLDNKKWILITHHCPFDPCQTQDIRAAITDDGYYTRMNLDKERFSHAIYGHNHLAADMEINGLRYLNNPFCYPQQKERKKKYNQYAHFIV